MNPDQQHRLSLAISISGWSPITSVITWVAVEPGKEGKMAPIKLKIMMLFEKTHKAPSYVINLFFKASVQMFSDFLKRVICSYRKKNKVSNPSGCKDRSFYCKSMCCCLVCSAARKMDTAQNQWCCSLASFILWVCYQWSWP